MSTNQFNFLGLPLVVQELITNEIVHNSIPEDRIQLALTSHYCKELVQRARPKKIIDQLSIWYYPRFTFIVNTTYHRKTKEQLMEILKNCQIKQLQLRDDPDYSTEDYSEIMDVLSEAARFATKFCITSTNPVHMDEIVEFYVKLKHLKSVTMGHAELILPYYPSKVKLELGSSPSPSPEFFLDDLAEKSQNSPLSFFELKSRVSLDKCRLFLQKAKFSTGAEIFILNQRPHVPIHLTYVRQNTFTFEMFSDDVAPILISQKFAEENRRILKLKTSSWLLSEIAFNVISASNSEKNYSSGVFKKFKDKMLINLENVDRDEILKIKFANEIFQRQIYGRVEEIVVRPKYSAEMLESAFPTANFRTPEERVKKINNVLGTNIQLIQADNFVKAVRKSQK